MTHQHFLTITPVCRCCASDPRWPVEIWPHDLAQGLRDAADHGAANRNTYASDGGQRRHVANLRALADKVETSGVFPHPSDFFVGLSDAERGLSHALRRLGLKGTPARFTVAGTKGARFAAPTYSED